MEDLIAERGGKYMSLPFDGSIRLTTESLIRELIRRHPDFIKQYGISQAKAPITAPQQDDYLGLLIMELLAQFSEKETQQILEGL